MTIDLLLIGGAAVAVYFLVKGGFTGLGIGTESANVSNQKALPGPQNPLNYQFQPFVDFYNNNTPSITGAANPGFWQGMISTLQMQANVQTIQNPTLQQFFQYLKSTPGQPSPWGYLDTVDLSARCESLYNALTVSPSHQLVMSDQQGAMSALSGLSNQLQTAFIANYFWWNFNTDLINFLQGGLFGGGLTDANLSALVSSVNALPVTS